MQFQVECPDCHEPFIIKDTDENIFVECKCGLKVDITFSNEHSKVASTN